MSSSRLFVRCRIFLGALGILLLAQAFNGGLSLSSLEKLYSQSLISGFELVGNEFLSKLQTAVRFGKSLEKFFGIEQAIHKVVKDLPELDDVLIALPDGTVVQALKPEHTGKNLDAVMQQGKPDSLHFVHKEGSSLVFKSETSRHLMFVIKDREDLTAGRIVFSFPESLIQQRSRAVLMANLKALGLASLGGAVLLALGLWCFLPFGPDGPSRTRLTLILVLALGGSQVGYSVYNLKLFRQDYIRMTREKTVKLAGLIRNDIETLLDKGMRIDRLVKIEKRFMELITATPEIEYMAVRDVYNRTLNKADRNGPVLLTDIGDLEAVPDNDPYYDILLPLYADKDDGVRKAVGIMEIHLSRKAVSARVQDILIDSVTVMVVAALFLVEMYLFLILYIKRTTRRTAPSEEDASQAPLLLGRIAGFAFLFMWALPASFIPLFMKQLYAPLFSLPRDVVLGLPISVEMLCTLCTALIAGALIDGHGWRLPVRSGLVICAGGNFLSGLASSGLEFIAFRGVTGLGYGLAWMSIQGFIFRFTTPLTRARGISNLVAGLISGQICGTAVGAMLAERIGYAPVFMASAALVLVPLAFTLLFMRGYTGKIAMVTAAGRLKWRELVSLLLHKDFMAILLFSLVPFALCQVGLLLYAAPIYLNQIGISQSNIGRVIMVYGLSVIYVAPYLSRFIDTSQRKKIYIALGGLIGAGGLMSLYFYSGFLAVLGAVFMMGLSGSLVGSSQTAYALKLDIIQRVGLGKAMSVQRAADKLGQMLGPIILGAMMGAVGISNGVVIVGVVFFLATVVFMFVAREEKDTAPVRK